MERKSVHIKFLSLIRSVAEAVQKWLKNESGGPKINKIWVWAIINLILKTKKNILLIIFKAYKKPFKMSLRSIF